MSNELVALIVDVGGMLLLGVFAYFIPKLIDAVNKGVSNQTAQGIIGRTINTIQAVVAQVHADYVKAIKRGREPGSEGGATLTDAEAAHARNMALRRVKTLLGEEGLQLLMYVIGFGSKDVLDTWLNAQIEKAVLEVKTAEKAGTVFVAAEETFEEEVGETADFLPLDLSGGEPS